MLEIGDHDLAQLDLGERDLLAQDDGHQQVEWPGEDIEIEVELGDCHGRKRRGRAGPAGDDPRSGVSDTAGPFVDTFWSAVVTGFLLALVAWLVEGTTTTSPISQIAVIWILTFLVALGSFDHCIATSVEAFASVLDGELGVGSMAGWLAAAVLGNVAGGVLVVAAINYGQVREED